MEEILIILVLIISNGLFSMAEMAIVTARKSRLTADAAHGSKAAGTALKLMEKKDGFLSAIQFGITLIGILTGIYSGNKIADITADMIAASLGISHSMAFGIAQTTIVIVVTYLTIVIGELVPKRIGLSAAEKVSKIIAIPMYALSTAAWPFVWLLSRSSELLFRLLNIDDHNSKVTEEEIKMIVREGKEDGEVQPVEENIVHRVFAVGNLEVDAIMTHRNDIVWLDIGMDADDIRDILLKNLYSIYPVADGSLDNLKGVATLKDLFVELQKPDFSLQSIISRPIFFYESTDVYKALERMKQQHTGYGLVSDEFGSCIGMITQKDILESIVGAVDENSAGKPDITERKDGCGWLVDGQCQMYDFLAHFDRLDLLEDKDYTTLGGLCLHTLEQVPDCGDTFEWNDFKIEVADMDGARIDKLIVTRKPAGGDTARQHPDSRQPCCPK